ncbi:phage baseplate assembly protein V [Taibaiella soli]|uniref:Gp5/Type VI secretion system Vgr protein OB-fold domain-containing protein n=1 Tax=Taibaiella soli TaxID=1649169 RepID=A0A2W2ASR1_9BACT|nr:phage baseplate assembly protein V [Taibaiella soli]PZF70984.1 hypothetical protein DN068_19960 [Taibaiella soli]
MPPESFESTTTRKPRIDWDKHDNSAAYTCADIFVGSYTIKSFESFQLSQSIAAHHTFELVIGHDALLSKDGSPVADDQWLANASKLMGEKISIGFYYHIWPDQKRWFEGIVTNVSYRRCTYGFGEIVIAGGSPTLLLDAAPHTQSFTNKTVQSIATEILTQAGLDTKNVKSRFGRPLPYSCQYNETHYNYLARLAASYGDWFWYDGEDLYFGKPFFKPDVKLVLGRDVYDMEASMNARHIKTEHYSYNSSDHEALRHDTFEIRGIDYFGEKALTASEQMFKTPTRQVAPVRAIDAKEVTASQKSQATAKATGLFNIKGRSTNPYLFPGCNVILEIRDVSTNKKTHYATLIIAELRQTLSYDGSYDCEFVGIPQKTENLPFHQFTLPIAEPQLATVVANADDKYAKANGRVKVQFPWQNEPTDFIRVMTPDAGSSDQVSKNRGLVFIPEIGSQVMVGFVHSNPDRPFVMGGMFHGQNGMGGLDNNHIKSIITRSGCTIQFDDTDGQGSVTVKDPSGNSFYLDGKGNINLTAPKKIIMSATDIEVNAYNNVELNVSNSLVMNIMSKLFVFTPFLKQVVSGAMQLFSGDALINASNTINIQGNDVTTQGKEKMVVHSDKLTTINSKDTTEVHGQTKNSFTNSPIDVAAAPPATLTNVIVEFRTLQTGYNGEFGFDWLRIDDNGATLEKPYYDCLDSGYEKPNGKIIGKGADGKPVYTDNNTEYDSKDEAFAALENEYLQLPINRKSNLKLKKYYVPWLNLYPKAARDAVATGVKPPYEATLRILVDVENEEPDQIRVMFDKKYFEINGKDGTDANPVLIAGKTIGSKREVSDQLKIKCIGEFATRQEILVYAYPKDSLTKSAAEQLTLRKLAGKIAIEPNKNSPAANGKPAVSNRKTQKFVLVPVETNIDGKAISGTFFPGEQENLQNAMHQALIHGEIEIYEKNGGILDLSNVNEFKITTSASGLKNYGKFIFSRQRDGHLISPDRLKNTTEGNLFQDYPNGEMFAFLKELFYKQPGNKASYSNHFIVFWFGVPPHDMQIFPNGSWSGTIGQVQDIGLKCVALFKPRNANTLSHEGLHGLGLHHTHSRNFSKDVQFTYQDYETTNVMSYAKTSSLAASKNTVWHWQWKIIKQHVQ